ncbi:MAG: BamA/TamA family outer membrane protein, partial [Quinella sp. 1Q7]|nr:BamA/TamA family outer membrane protein [Quinella sp. 1Q7]
RNEGFVLMKVTDMNMSPEGVLTLKINEGTLEGYAVKGNKKTKDVVILREMRQEVGTPFNAKLARRSMQRVYNLGFFEDVNINMKSGVEPNAVIMEVVVKERRTGTFGVGAGYSTSDGIIGMVSLSDTNFRGRGDLISIVYEKSGDENDAHGYNFTYRHPWMDSRETAFRIQLYNRTYSYNDYDTHGDFKEEYMRRYTGGEITFSRPVSEYSTNYITLRNRKDKYVRHVSSGNAGDRSGSDYAEWRKNNFGLTRAIILEHITDTRDNVYSPTDGNKVNIALEVGAFGGDFDYQKLSLDHQNYRKAGDHDQVWAIRGMIGYGRGDMTEFNQFRVGGQGSLRGYRDDQFRGNRMMLGSIEYRFPLYKRVQGALFTDFGSAWNGGFRPRDFKASIGLGVALNTPMGPLRLDYGRGSQGGRFHFSVGTSF